MNLSGSSIYHLLKRKENASIVPSKLLFVAHDELSIPPCTWSFQFGGSIKGHNGLRSVEDRIKTKDWHRIRIGIGRPEGDTDKKRKSKIPISDWVLSASDRDEMELCSDPRGKLVEAAWEYIEEQRNKLPAVKSKL